MLKVKLVLDEMLEKLPDEFNMTELMGKVEERSPYVVVALQECERMNILTHEIKRSLKELSLGLKVLYSIDTLMYTHCHTLQCMNIDLLRVSVLLGCSRLSGLLANLIP